MDGPSRSTAKALAEMDRANEDRWIYELRLRYMTIDAIARRANAPKRRHDDGSLSLQGGLGRPMSRFTVQSRLSAYAAEIAASNAELASTARDTELERIEAMSGEALGQIARCREAIARAAEAGYLDVHAEKQLTASLRTMASLAKLRADLAGLNAPLQVEVSGEVGHYDTEARELAGMLDEATKADKKARKKAAK